MTTLLEPKDRRKHATTKGEVDKRGRGRGFLGWFRGHPWATRQMILTTTYTSSYLEYYKGDDLRDRIDIIDSTAETNDDITKAGGRAFAINVTLATGEVLMLAPYSHDERTTWLHRLNIAGLIPTAADRMAQQYSLNCLSELHESVAYTYFVFKAKNAIHINQLKQYYEAASEAINITDEEQSTLLSSILELWFTHLNSSHPKLYTKTSDSVEVERHFETEYERTIQAHEMDAERATASYADEGMITKRMKGYVMRSQCEYVFEKEHRFMETIADLVERFR